MKKFEKFLFFYSIVAITVLFISYGIFSPTPLNFISGVLLLPIVFYFWVRLTSPESVGPERWSFRFLTVLVLIASMFIFGYYLTSKGIGIAQKADELKALKDKLTDTEAQNTNLSQSLASISAELIILKGGSSTNANANNPSVADLILGTPSSIPLQEFTGRSGVNLIDVYDSPNISAKKISTLDGTQTYLYLEKQNNWYKVLLSGSNVGWISSSQIQEVNN